MNIPKRRTRPKMGVRESSVIRCPGHLQWVRGCECVIEGLQPDGVPLGDSRWNAHHICEGKIEAHHVREGDHGHGMGLKPDDSSAVPLCSAAHKRGHDMGWKTFERMWLVDLSDVAADLWKASPHGQKYRREHQS